MLARYRAVLSDLDGCLVAGDTVLPGARELVAGLGARLVLVSNNSTDTPESLSARLARLGLAIPARRIVLAGTSALELVAAERPGARVRLFGSARLEAHAGRLGLSLVRRDAAAVVLARDTGFAYADLAELVALLDDGAELVVTNPDGCHPGAGGAIVPETGALLAAVRACLPDLVHRTVGKPGALMFRRALEIAGAAPAEALFIGDNPATDGRGAAAAGMAFALVAPRTERGPGRGAVTLPRLLDGAVPPPPA